MRKTLLISAITALSVSIALPANAVQGATIDQRVKRLERMLENPVLLQLSRRLGEQQRDIQTLQDENDRLQRELRKLRTLMDKRYKENDDRFSALETGVPVLNSPAVNTIQDVQKKGTPVVLEPSTSEGSSSASSNDVIMTELTIVESGANLKNDKLSVEKTAQELAVTKVAPTTHNPIEKSEPTKIVKTRASTDAEKTEYKTAFSLMRASKYDAAIKSFEIFLATHPKSDLASNAAYWTGEGYLIKEKNQAALDAFMVVIESYPDSSKVPDAKLRAGDSQERLGNRAEAEKLYQDIIDSRPNSRAAKNAKKRLVKF